MIEKAKELASKAMSEVNGVDVYRKTKNICYSDAK